MAKANGLVNVSLLVISLPNHLCRPFSSEHWEPLDLCSNSLKLFLWVGTFCTAQGGTWKQNNRDLHSVTDIMHIWPPQSFSKTWIDLFLTSANQWSQPGGTCATPPASLLPYWSRKLTLMIQSIDKDRVWHIQEVCTYYFCFSLSTATTYSWWLMFLHHQKKNVISTAVKFFGDAERLHLYLIEIFPSKEGLIGSMFLQEGRKGVGLLDFLPCHAAAVAF